MFKDAAIAIPVYKKEITPYETYSFVQCNKVFKHYDRILFAPAGLCLDEYLKADSDLKVVNFPDACFESHRAYDRLMLEAEFYEKFLSYRYILIYQLDSFVFRDELQQWCSTGYDYIGAPWIENPLISNIAANCTRARSIGYNIIPRYRQHVGNGGFCLRNVRSVLTNLRLFGSKARTWPYYEDTFFSFFINSYNPFFRIPGQFEALRFAFEMKPSQCYEINQRHLPFGCHAWEKYDIGFWRPHFEAVGYTL